MKLARFEALDGNIYSFWPDQLFIQTRKHKTYLRSIHNSMYVELDMTHEEAEKKLQNAKVWCSLDR